MSLQTTAMVREASLTKTFDWRPADREISSFFLNASRSATFSLQARFNFSITPISKITPFFPLQVSNKLRNTPKLGILRDRFLFFFLFYQFSSFCIPVLHLIKIKIWFQNRRTKWKRKFSSELESIAHRYYQSLGVTDARPMVVGDRLWLFSLWTFIEWHKEIKFRL